MTAPKKRKDQEPIDNPDWIQGIYNYCDRWCERCAFTGKCRSFAMEVNQINESGSPDSDSDVEHDIRSKEFWEELGVTLSQTLDYLRTITSDSGGETVAMNDQQWDKLKKRDEELEQAAKDHPLALSAWKYSDLAENWLTLNSDLIKNKTEELERQVKLDAGGKRATVENGLITDALQIIRWYEPQIWVKLMRALTGRISNEESNNCPRDSDGSAKVALIGIDRSLAAWGQLQFIFPDETNDFITVLLHLDRLRRKVEIDFPNARSFKRAGFDDEQGEEI